MPNASLTAGQTRRSAARIERGERGAVLDEAMEAHRAPKRREQRRLTSSVRARRRRCRDASRASDKRPAPRPAGVGGRACRPAASSRRRAASSRPPRGCARRIGQACGSMKGGRSTRRWPGGRAASSSARSRGLRTRTRSATSSAASAAACPVGQRAALRAGRRASPRRRHRECRAPGATAGPIRSGAL